MFGHRLADAGPERRLELGVQPGPRGAQVAQAVGDPVHLVGLEGQQPLVVAEPEGATVLARTSSYSRPWMPCSDSMPLRS
jgi:hypothetical protein